jgi:hypothetical protein
LLPAEASTNLTADKAYLEINEQPPICPEAGHIAILINQFHNFGIDGRKT